jgi:DNA replication protein DnaC
VPEKTTSIEEPKEICSVCNGQRFVHPRLADGTPDYSCIIDCKCVFAERALERKQGMVKWCELPVKTEHCTFDNFKISAKLKEAYEEARLMAAGEYLKPFLTLMGPSDNGKTHLLIAICRSWLEQGKLARYAFVPLLLDELRAGFAQGNDGIYEERWKNFLNVPLLALDDLGTENPTQWAQEHLDTLIDYRMVNGLFTVVTTNLTFDELQTRIGSRLMRSGKIVSLSAPSYCKANKEINQSPENIKNKDSLLDETKAPAVETKPAAGKIPAFKSGHELFNYALKYGYNIDKIKELLGIKNPTEITDIKIATEKLFPKEK